jgi:hypothetical protein
MDETEKRWTKIAAHLLLGKTITNVRYMKEEETGSLGWSSKAIVLHVQDKQGNEILVYPSMDDEGNGAGSLFTTDENEQVIPVLPA